MDAKKKKIWHGLIASVITILLLAICFAWYHHSREALKRHYALYQEALRHLNSVSFISNDKEYRAVMHAAVRGELKNGIAIYLPFYTASEKQDLLNDIAVRYCRAAHLPVMVYGMAGQFDKKAARRILSREVRGCIPMVCAGNLWLGSGKSIINCVADDEAKTEPELRSKVLFGLKSLKESIKEWAEELKKKIQLDNWQNFGKKQLAK